ncbi:asparagine synthase-related protein [Akkermansiaceae bacterium]|nr:asparagine synthase-related protein [Akkermansiaceae bacterium]
MDITLKDLDCLELGNFLDPCNFNSAAYYNNIMTGMNKRQSWEPIFRDVNILYEGMYRSQLDGAIIDPVMSTSVEQSPMNRDLFIERFKDFLLPFKESQLGVQLSGGLDSGVIIGLLNALELDYSLIGMQSGRYEFRTESHVQNLYKSSGKEVYLLDYEDYLPFSGIENIPNVDIPDVVSVDCSSAIKMAELCRSLGIEVLLSGMGGDVVFVEDANSASRSQLWKPQTHACDWIRKYVYQPAGVDYLSPYTDLGLAESIYHMRRGEPADPFKKWARNYFRDYIPRELADFTYCGDYWSMYLDGFSQNRHHILDAYESIQRESGIEIYKADTIISKIEKGDILRDKKSFSEYEYLYSLLSWLLN